MLQKKEKRRKVKTRIKPCYYCDKYDAKYNKKGKWLESKCHDKKCEFCSNRPERHPVECNCSKDDSTARSHYVKSNRIVKWIVSRMNLQKYHVHIHGEECNYVLVYGRSRLLQWLYIYNPIVYWKSYLTYKHHILTSKYNCGWISSYQYDFRYKKLKKLHKKRKMEKDKRKNMKREEKWLEIIR